MAIRKDLIIAVLATFCLTSTLFMMFPIKSQTSNGTYDPWMDLNDDGVIDSTDLGLLGEAWGTYGDSTKNVNVTNWPEWMFQIVDLEKSVFSETLVLKGGSLGLARGGHESVLIAMDTPNPKLGDVWSGPIGGSQYHPIFDETFAQSQHAIIPYNITDMLIGTLHFRIIGHPTEDGDWWIKGQVDVGRRFSNGSTMAVYSENIAERGVLVIHGTSVDFHMSYAYLLPQPLTISEGEKILVNVYLEAKGTATWGEIGIICTEYENDFMLLLSINKT